MASALFPTGSAQGPESRDSLWSGLSKKAGARAADVVTLGAAEGTGTSQGSTSVAVDRPIHLIDGLARKTQDDENAVSKGTLASINNPEKLNVVLARSCGELTVEMCPGSTVMRLFLSRKRRPVYITNRVGR